MGAQSRPAGHRGRPATPPRLARAHQLPSYGLVRPRSDLDALLANRAVSAGAVLHEQTTVTEPVLDRAGRVAGVQAKTGADKTPVTYRAPIVLSCDGVSGKLAQQLGLHRNGRRPMGVAVRRYYASPRTHDDYLRVVAGDVGRPDGCR